MYNRNRNSQRRCRQKKVVARSVCLGGHVPFKSSLEEYKKKREGKNARGSVMLQQTPSQVVRPERRGFSFLNQPVMSHELILSPQITVWSNANSPKSAIMMIVSSHYLRRCAATGAVGWGIVGLYVGDGTDSSVILRRFISKPIPPPPPPPPLVGRSSSSSLPRFIPPELPLSPGCWVA